LLDDYNHAGGFALDIPAGFGSQKLEDEEVTMAALTYFR
jgi:hypothetical protein